MSLLAVGRYGPQVKLIQNQLALQGYSLSPSELQRSFFGPTTRAALIQWQLENGLPGTGVLDDRTISQLAVSGVVPLSPISKAQSGNGARTVANGSRTVTARSVTTVTRTNSIAAISSVKTAYSPGVSAASSPVRALTPSINSNIPRSGRDLKAQAQAEGNLFTIQKGGFQAWAHGKAFATATASINRGFQFDLETGLSASAGGNAQLGQTLVAQLQAGAGVDIALDAEIGFPLDLFSQAGLIARLQLITEVKAFARLDVNLLLGDFNNQLTARLPKAWGTLIQIFLDEVEIGAGVFGRIAFAAEVVGEAVLVGSLLPAANGASAGFTYSTQYGYAYYFGAGGHAVCNFDIKDSARLLNRLGKELTSIVQAEVAKDLQNLQTSDPKLAKAVSAAAPYLDLLMPLASRAVFELAANLISTPTADHPSTSAKQIVDSFLSDARAFAMQKVLDFALGELHKLLAQLSPALQQLSGAFEQKTVTDAISTARDAAATLYSTSLSSSPDDWLDAVLSLIGAFDNFLAIGLFNDADTASWQTLTADVWAGAMLLRAGIEWEQQTGASGFSLTAPVKLPSGDSTVASFVASKIGKSPDALTLADIVSYLVSQLSDSDVIASIPELEKVFGWLKALLGGLSAQTNTNLFSLVLATSEGISPAQIQSFLVQLGTSLADTVDNQLTPNILSRLSTNPEVGDLVSQIVTPTLKSIGKVILPNLAKLGTEDAARRLREAISSVLLQQLTRLIMHSVRTITDVGLTQAIPAAETLASDIEKQGTSHPVFNDLTLAASSVVLGTPLTPTDIANLLRASQAVLKVAQPALPKILDDIEAIISLGLTIGQPELEAIWTNIATTDNPPNQQALQQLFADGGNLMLAVGWEIIQSLPNLLLQHFTSTVEAVADTIWQAAKTAFKAIQEVINQLEADINAIEQDIQRLAAAVATFVGNLAGAIQALDQQIQGLVDGIVSQIQADGWALISPLVPGFLQGAAQDIYNGIFNDVRWLLDEPLKVLGAVADWIHDAVMAAVGAGGTISVQGLLNYVQGQLQNIVATDLTFTISIPIPFDGSLDLGTITLPAASVISRIVGSVIGELENLLGVSGGVVDIGSNLVTTQQQLSAKQATQASYSTQADATAAVSGMKTGKVPTITIVTPTQSAVYSGGVGLLISIGGINDSFLRSTLGVPRRVRIYFNGAEYDYSPDDWTQSRGAEIFSAQLVPTSRGLVARPPLNVPWTVQLNPAGDGTWVLRQKPSAAGLAQYRKTNQPVLKARATASGTSALASSGVSRMGSVGFSTTNTGNVGLAGITAAGTGSVSMGGSRGGMVTFQGTGALGDASESMPQMMSPGALLAAVGPTIVLRPGLNTAQLIVVEGDDNGTNRASALVQFFLKQSV
jgi:hypothetical protein